MFASPAGSPPSQPRRSSQPQSEPAQPERPRQSNANEGGEIEGAATCVSCVSLANKPKLLASRPATFWFSTLLKTNLNHPEPALVFHPLENQLEPSRAKARRAMTFYTAHTAPRNDVLNLNHLVAF